MRKVKIEKNIRDKWIKSLRSGRYKQTEGRLFDGGSYCCLGVLARNLGFKKEQIEGIGDFSNESFYFKNKEKIPKFIVDNLINTEFSNTLIKMNDDLYYDFEEIADYIEKNSIGY